MEENKEIIFRLYSDINKRVFQKKGYRKSGKGFSQYRSTAKPAGLRTFNEFFSAVNESFPDFNIRIDSLICKADKVMTRYTITGTHKAHFMGMAPTNEIVNICGIDIFRIENGKVVEHWDAAHQIKAVSNTPPEYFPDTELIVSRNQKTYAEPVSALTV
jgi:predicted ester cyclase